MKRQPLKRQLMRRYGMARVEGVALGAVTLLLAAVLLPAALAQMNDQARSRENARRMACQNNLKQLALGVMQYVQDYDEALPIVAGSPNSHAFGWAEALYPYIKSPEIYQCPNQKHKRGTDPRRPGYTDYWYNRKLSRVYMNKVRYTANTLLAGDGDGGSPQSTARYAIDRLPRSWVSTAGSPARRHVDGANYAYVDGHIKWLKPSRVTTAKPAGGVNTFAVK